MVHKVLSNMFIAIMCSSFVTKICLLLLMYGIKDNIHLKATSCWDESGNAANVYCFTCIGSRMSHLVNYKVKSCVLKSANRSFLHATHHEYRTSYCVYYSIAIDRLCQYQQRRIKTTADWETQLPAKHKYMAFRGKTFARDAKGMLIPLRYGCISLEHSCLPRHCIQMFVNIN